MLSADQITVRRGARIAIDGLSATFAPGQITAIVGPNGAGKSSLLMALAGLLPAATGTVSLGGNDLSALPARERARQIGYLPQSAEIAWDVAVENLVALGRLPHRDASAEPVDAAIAAMGLEDLRARPASRLSGGEKARVLLARVVAGTPRWILADEPLAALDLAHQAQLIAHLRGCAERGIGVFIVLHDLAMAINHADRVLVLSEGRLAAAGNPVEALSRERIAQVWGFAGEWIGKPGQRAIVASEHD